MLPVLLVEDVHLVRLSAASDNREHVDLAEQRSIGVAFIEKLSVWAQRPANWARVQRARAGGCITNLHAWGGGRAHKQCATAAI